MGVFMGIERVTPAIYGHKVLEHTENPAPWRELGRTGLPAARGSEDRSGKRSNPPVNVPYLRPNRQG